MVADDVKLLRGKIVSLKDELCSMDPFWNKCFPCRNNGRCCVKSDVDVTDDEWDEIVDFLKDKPKIIEYGKVRLKLGKPCLFYCSEASKCLIHEVRPIMCRYAPFHIVEKDGTYFYNLVDEHCLNIKSDSMSSLVKTSNSLIADIDGSKRIIIDEVPEMKEYKKNKIDFLSTKFHNSFVKEDNG